MSDAWLGDCKLVKQGVEVLVADPEAGGSGREVGVSYTVTGMAG
jgi:ABC-type sulfate transport system substrate-binding protein